jgi:hypothetical protein
VDADFMAFMAGLIVWNRGVNIECDGLVLVSLSV